jgi:hypothetical protein
MPTAEIHLRLQGHVAMCLVAVCITVDKCALHGICIVLIVIKLLHGI